MELLEFTIAHHYEDDLIRARTLSAAAIPTADSNYARVDRWMPHLPGDHNRRGESSSRLAVKIQLGLGNDPRFENGILRRNRDPWR